MRGPKALALFVLLMALAIAALTVYAYRELLARPFAADDYQWLLAVQGLRFREVIARAFDAGAQVHFYRPLVWLLFWAQGRAFGLDPRGYHVVSLALHLLNAVLLGGLAYRVSKGQGTRDRGQEIGGGERGIENWHRGQEIGGKGQERESVGAKRNWSFVFGPLSAFVFRLSSAVVAGAIVALHPAPFEAVAWISAQSELLAAALLLVMLHLWLSTTDDRRPTATPDAHTSIIYRPSSIVFSPWSALVLATLALALALLAKESAIIGLPLLFLADCRNDGVADRRLRRYARYTLPILVTIGYLALQVAVERRNYLLRQGGYGFGPQIVLNPLRSMALLVAPLPGTEHADAAWLVPLGAIVAIMLLGWFIYDLQWGKAAQPGAARRNARLLLALALILLPTAPFASPPDSRYLYLPVMAAALLIAGGIDQGRKTKDEGVRSSVALRPWSLVFRHAPAIGTAIVVLAFARYSAGELHEREWRFAAGAGPGGSLWRLATSACAENHPDRMVVVEPPLAGPHAEAIVELACGKDVNTLIVGRDQVAGAIKGHTVVVGFPGGSAQVQPQP